MTNQFDERLVEQKFLFYFQLSKVVLRRYSIASSNKDQSSPQKIFHAVQEKDVKLLPEQYTYDKCYLGKDPRRCQVLCNQRCLEDFKEKWLKTEKQLRKRLIVLEDDFEKDKEINYPLRIGGVDISYKPPNQRNSHIAKVGYVILEYENPDDTLPNVICEYVKYAAISKNVL